MKTNNPPGISIEFHRDKAIGCRLSKATRVERKRNDNCLFDAFAGFRRTYSVEHWRPCKQRLTFSSFNVQALKVSTKTNRAGVLRVFLQILVSKYSPFLDKRAYVESLFCACSSIFFVGLLALQNPHKFYIWGQCCSG